MAKIKTLTEFITDQQALNPGAKGDLFIEPNIQFNQLQIKTEK